MIRKKLSRREFLNEVAKITSGSALASQLPIFQAFAQTKSAPLRLVIITKGSGWITRAHVHDDNFKAVAGSEFGFQLPYYWSSLKPFQKYITVVKNLRGTYWGNAHNVSYPDMLTNNTVHNETGSLRLGTTVPEPLGESIDWLIGNRLMKKVLRLSLHNGSNSSDRIWFNDKSIWQKPIFNLTDAYDEVVLPIKIFQEGGSTSDLYQQELNKELFGLLNRSAERISKKLGPGIHNEKISTFQEAIDFANPNNNILKSILQKTPTYALPDSTTMTKTDLIQESFRLMKTAFLADSHRIATIHFPEQAPLDRKWYDQDRNPHSGVEDIKQYFKDVKGENYPGFHHSVSHYSEEKGPYSQMTMNGCISYYIEEIAKFVSNLSTTIDVDGRPMIDNTLILMTGDVSDGNHNRTRKPHILIGGGGAGNLKTGRIIDCPLGSGKEVKLTRNRDGKVSGESNYVGDTEGVLTHGDLFVSIARAMGVSISTFGMDVRNSSPVQLTS